MKRLENSQTIVAMRTAKKSRKTPARKTLLQQLANVPDKLFTGEFRQQYGAICFRHGMDDRVEILLITSRDTGRWVIPKGWPMKKKKPFEAAALEAWQEAGVIGHVTKKSIGRYTYLKWLDNDDVTPCVVDLYQIEVAEMRQNFKERGQRIISWMSPEEAARRVRELELKSLLVDFKPRV